MMVEEITPLRAAELAVSEIRLREVKDRPMLERELPQLRDKTELRNNVISLRLQGKTYAEIAKCLKISIGYAHRLASSRRYVAGANPDDE